MNSIIIILYIISIFLNLAETGDLEQQDVFCKLGAPQVPIVQFQEVLFFLNRKQQH